MSRAGWWTRTPSKTATSTTTSSLKKAALKSISRWIAILLLVRNVAAVAAAASVLDPIGRKHQSVCCVCVFFFFNFAV